MTSAADEAPTFAACLTPRGSAAIATLALRGPRAPGVIHKLFRCRPHSTPWPPGKFEPGSMWLGHFGQGPESGAADEVVLAVKRARPFPWFEVHCHGGAEVVDWLLETLEAQGIPTVSWQELERRTAADPLQARTLVALAEAATLRTASILLDQERGCLGRALDEVRAALTHEEFAEAGRLLEKMLRHASVGRHLTTPWRVVVLGAPNVGKSSLVNALAGFQRSIVAPTPGTTRDVVTTRLAVDGWPIELADTAGLRDATEALEEEGIGLAQAAADRADLRLWVMDAAASPSWPVGVPEPVYMVINKVDLPPAWDLTEAANAVRVSALTGAGMPELCQALSDWLVPDPPPPAAAVPFTPALVNGLEEASTLLRERCFHEALRRLDALGASRDITAR